MPATTLPPIKDPEGVSARELLFATRTGGGPVQPPLTVTGGRNVITLHAGPAVVLTAVPLAVTRWYEGDTDRETHNAGSWGRISFQCPVLASTVPSGTRLALRVLQFRGGSWIYLNDAADGPWIPLDAVDTDGGIPLPILSGWFTVDDEAKRDNITLEWVTYGGNSTGEVTIGKIVVLTTADALPPTQEIPDPEAPTGALWADWDPTEGTGEIIANKVPGGPTRDLILGDSISNTDRNPTSWSTIPPRLTTSGFLTVDHHYLRYNAPPSLAAGSSLFFYGLITTLGGGDKYLCGVTVGVGDHYIYVSSATGFASCVVKPAGGSPVTVTGTTVISNGSEHTFCLTHDGTTLKLYIDAVLEGSAGCGTADEPGGRVLTFCCGDPPTTAENGPDVYLHGRSLLYTGAMTASQVAEAHAAFKLTYGGLP